MKIPAVTLALWLVAFAAFADVPVYHGTVAFQIPDDPELKNLAWHRWTTKNFTVLSLNEKQGEFLAKNLEQIKTWAAVRWGLPDLDYVAECRVLAVPSEALMKKLFKLDESRVEVRKDEQGKPKLYATWLLLHESPARTLAGPITQINLQNLAASNKINMGIWAEKGISGLNKTIPQIRSDLLALSKIQNLPYNVSNLFSTTPKDWQAMNPESKKAFEIQSMVLLLLLRKEFGEAKLHQLLRANNPQSELWTLLSFRDYEELNKSYMRYVRDLIAAGDKIPEHYLEIKSK